MNADAMLRRIKQKEQAYLDRMAGKIHEELPAKKYWWENDEQEGD
jgi:hypothetical protein